MAVDLGPEGSWLPTSSASSSTTPRPARSSRSSAASPARRRFATRSPRCSTSRARSRSTSSSNLGDLLGPLPPSPPTAAGEIDQSLLDVLADEVAFGAAHARGRRQVLRRGGNRHPRARGRVRSRDRSRRRGSRPVGARDRTIILVEGVAKPRPRLSLPPAVVHRLLRPDARADPHLALPVLHRLRPADPGRTGSARTTTSACSPTTATSRRRCG